MSGADSTTMIRECDSAQGFPTTPAAHMTWGPGVFSGSGDRGIATSAFTPITGTANHTFAGVAFSFLNVGATAALPSKEELRFRWHNAGIFNQVFSTLLRMNNTHGCFEAHGTQTDRTCPTGTILEENITDFHVITWDIDLGANTYNTTLDGVQVGTNDGPFSSTRPINRIGLTMSKSAGTTGFEVYWDWVSVADEYNITSTPPLTIGCESLYTYQVTTNASADQTFNIIGNATPALSISASGLITGSFDSVGSFVVNLTANISSAFDFQNFTIASTGPCGGSISTGCDIPVEVLPQLPPEDPGRLYNRGFFGVDGSLPAGTQVWLSDEVFRRPIPRDGQYAGYDMEALFTTQTLFDFLTRGNDGLINGTLENVQGLFGRGRCFTQTQSVDIGLTDRFDKMAVIVWASINSTNNSDHAVISSGTGWTLGYNNTTWYFSFNVENATFRVNSTETFALNAWQGVAAGFDGFDAQLTVDGETNRTRFFSAETNIDEGSTILIGMDPSNLSFATHGIVDEVAVFSTALDNNTMFWATQRPAQVQISDPPDPPEGISGITLQSMVVWAAVFMIGAIIFWAFFVAIRGLREKLGR